MNELYIIPDRSCIEASMQLAKEYGTYFEYNDFFLPELLDNELKVKELIAFYRGLDRDRSRDMLHGAFLDVTIHSEDEKIRKVSELRVRQSVEIGIELGIRGVIFHTNIIPNFKTPTYMRHWVDSNERFWRQLLADYPDIELLIENMFDDEPDLLAELAEKMKDEPRFGVCFDYAHALVFGKQCEIESWVKKLLPYTHHMHINDNDLKLDLHQTVGKGRIDWSCFTGFMQDGKADCSVLIEIRESSKQRASLEYMKQEAIYPFHMLNREKGKMYER